MIPIAERLRDRLVRRAPRLRVLVFSPPRCGSTTLLRLLDAHPDLDLVYEPFNPARAPQFGASTAATRGEVRRRLARIGERHSGFKHVWNPFGWPFPAESALNECVLREAADRTLVLERRNRLRQVVSNAMAQQSGGYHRRAQYPEGDEEERVRGFEYGPLAPREIEAFLTRLPVSLERHRSVLAATGRPFLELRFEDWLGEDLDRDRRRNAVGEVFSFLGLSLAEVDADRVDPLLDPSQARVNDAASYRRVPDIEAIEERFGGDETGWLFR